MLGSTLSRHHVYMPYGLVPCTSLVTNASFGSSSTDESFLQRFTQQYQETKNNDAAEIKLGDATTMRDLCVAFYYRFLQTKVGIRSFEALKAPHGEVASEL